MLCIATKNKKCYDRCPRKAKGPEFKFCGTHRRAKNPRLFVNIVPAQALARGWLTRLRTSCVNREDLYTCEPLPEVRLFFSYVCPSTGSRFGFDARTFAKLDGINPYNREPVPEKVLERFWRDFHNISQEPPDICDRDLMTEEQRFRDDVLAVFHKMDMLDNYTDYRWFLDMGKGDLVALYRKMKSLWYSRYRVSPYTRCQVLAGKGRVFSLNTGSIEDLPKRKLQEILLRDFDRMISSSADVDNRKLGAILIISGLVRVSESAARALPMYL